MAMLRSGWALPFDVLRWSRLFRCENGLLQGSLCRNRSKIFLLFPSRGEGPACATSFIISQGEQVILCSLVHHETK